MIDLLLVNPCAKAENYGPLMPFSAIEPPLWCALLAAYIRERGYTVDILDAEALNLDADDTAVAVSARHPRITAIIAIGINPSVSSTPKMTVVNKLAEDLRWAAPYTKVVIGGLHPSALPARTLGETGADYLIQGEGFEALLNLVRGDDPSGISGLWRAGKCRPPYGGAAQSIEVDSLPMAAWDLLPMDKYRCHNWQALGDPGNRSPYAMVYTSLGCPYSCRYCQVHKLYNDQHRIRYRDAGAVAAEIDHLARTWGIRHIKFMDEVFALNKSRVIQVCDEIKALGHDLNIWAYARPDTVDPEMLAAMRGAGINWLAFGFESAEWSVRGGVSKKYKSSEIGRVADMCGDAGINIIANFMFGLPDDDHETMRATLDVAKSLNFEYVNFYACAAYPGCELYDEALEQGVKMPDTWADWGQFAPGFVPLPTRHLKAQEVLAFRDNAFHEYFQRPEYLNMIEGKFGLQSRLHIEDMLEVRLTRVA